MHRSRKVVLAAAGGLAVLLALLIVSPLLFVDRIEARVRAEIERAARVRVAWSDVRLGLLRDFPRATLGLTELSVLGTGAFDGDTLAAADDLRLTLDLGSVVGSLRGPSPLVIRSVRVGDPRVRLRVAPDGAASWDVLPASGPEAEPRSGAGFAVSLRSLELSGGDVVFDDARSGTYLSLAGLEHSLRGDFARASVEASTRTRAEAVTLRVAGMPYLTGVSLDFAGDLAVDMAEGRARLADSELRLNDLVVRLDGSVAKESEATALDLSFSAPSTDFGQLLSLVSTIYEADFGGLETSGTFSLQGHVRGRIAPEDLPSFGLEVNVVDGRFRDHDLPAAFERIGARLAVTNPGGSLDATVLDLADFHMQVGTEVVDGSVVVRTPISDPEVTARVVGTIDLGSLGRGLRAPALEGVAGVVVADASVRARRSDVDSARYDRIDARGTISARDITLRGEALRQPVDVNEVRLQLTPRSAELETFDARLGSSDVRASGRLDNLLGFVLGEQPLSGSATFTSGRMMLDEWRSGRGVEAIAVPPRLDLTLEGSIDRLELNGIQMTDARGRAIVRDERVTFEGFRLHALGGAVALDGHYETTDPQRPTFALALGLDTLDIAQSSAAALTFRTLAPIASYARGTYSTALELSGAIGPDMAPELEALEGAGSLETSRVAIEGFPPLDRLGQTLRLARLSNPAVDAVRSSIRIQSGRLVVDPFRVGVGGLAMTVSGSNGIDQSVDYDLTLEVPRAGLADDALTTLASRSGPLGARLATLDPVPVTVRLTGTVRDPSLDVRVSEAAASARAAVTDAAAAAAQSRIDDAQERLDASRAEARRRAEARADSIVAEAERQAEAIRTEAARAGAEVRAQGDRAADELLARASNPLARAAAQPAADRLRREADERASRLEEEADRRAAELVVEARERAEALRSGGG